MIDPDVLLAKMAFLESKIDTTFITNQNIAKLYPDKTPFERLRMLDGYTTHSDFEIISIPGEMSTRLSYRLKPHCSATQALEKLFTHNNKIFIDCIIAMNLARYLAILDSMKKKHGEVGGANRFDQFFGSTENEVPVWRRLILSRENVYLGTPIMPSTTFWQALTCFIDNRRFDNKAQMFSEIQKGNIIFFQGDLENYATRHPAGANVGNLCVVSDISPLQVRTFGAGNYDYTEARLTIRHINALHENPSEESKVLIGWENNDLNLSNQKRELGALNIVGFIPFTYIWVDTAIDILINAPVAHALNFIQEIYKLKDCHVDSYCFNVMKINLQFAKFNAQEDQRPNLSPLILSAKRTSSNEKINEKALSSQTATIKTNTTYCGLRKGFLN